MDPNGLLVFSPLYQERVWGGRRFETSFGRSLPEEGVAYGESWEVVDREGYQSVVAEGSLAGKTLGELWSGPGRAALFGSRAPDSPRFPLLVKILDASEHLSLQVHPGPHHAIRLGGEPKTEMWYTVDAEPGAELIVGLRNGVDRSGFAAAVAEGGVRQLVHSVPAARDTSVTIPGGRLHAIGAGVLVFEIQQNSDTTYRVHDWGRLGLDGCPRELHIGPALECIDFDDVEPSLVHDRTGRVAETPFFAVDRIDLGSGDAPVDVAPPGECAVVGVVAGPVACGDRQFGAGDFFVVTAARAPGAALLHCPAGRGGGARLLVATFPPVSRLEAGRAAPAQTVS